jgi:hypothetical protein
MASSGRVAPCLTIRQPERIPLIPTIGEVTAVAPPVSIHPQAEPKTLPERSTRYPVSVRV